MDADQASADRGWAGGRSAPRLQQGGRQLLSDLAASLPSPPPVFSMHAREHDRTRLLATRAQLEHALGDHLLDVRRHSLRYQAASNEHAQLHVGLHGLGAEVRARHEGQTAVRDGALDLDEVPLAAGPEPASLLYFK